MSQKKYLIKKVTNYFEEEKPERMGRIVRLVNEPEIGHKALFVYEDGDTFGFATTDVQDIHYFRCITTGELEMVIETKNSIYHLVEVEDGQTEEE